MVGRLCSFLNGPFWGDMLISRGISTKPSPHTKKNPQRFRAQTRPVQNLKASTCSRGGELADSPSPFRNPWEKNVLKPYWNTLKPQNHDKRTVVSEDFWRTNKPLIFSLYTWLFSTPHFCKGGRGGEVGKWIENTSQAHLLQDKKKNGDVEFHLEGSD